MRYILSFTVFTLFILCLVATFNWLIDPYGNYWSPLVDGLNAKKTQAASYVRNVTPYRADQIQPEVLLVGNSRVQLGLAAESKVLSGSTVYNIALPGAGLATSLQHSMYQMQHNPNLKDIVIALDFRYFLADYSHRSSWNDATLLPSITLSEISDYERLKIVIRSLISLDSLFSSFLTIFSQDSTVNIITSLGSNTGGWYLDAIRNEGKVDFYSFQMKKLTGKFERKNLSYKSNEFQNNINIDRLNLFITLANKNHANVKIHLYINPYHYSYWHQIYKTGHWSDYLQWKVDLIKLSLKFDNINIYDFSIPSIYTLEYLNFEKNKRPMQWYWEPAHYRQALGDVILDAIFNPELGCNKQCILLDNTSEEKIRSTTQYGLDSTSKQWDIDKIILDL
ncbi:MAG: hypothetical protein ACJA13_000904 [Paraglaciecola sp.]|jgi:hypothetical protein